MIRKFFENCASKSLVRKVFTPSSRLKEYRFKDRRLDYGIVSVSVSGNISTVVMNRGKVSALTEEVVDELSSSFQELSSDPNVRAVIVTGSGKFFFFGFDISTLWAIQERTLRVISPNLPIFILICSYSPKAVIAALNDHTVAGGCMIATACDYRIMVTGKAKISLNEITFGSSVFAGSVEMLKACVGHRNAEPDSAAYSCIRLHKRLKWD